MKNPFFKPNKSELIFDGDYNPKGLAFNLSFGDVFSNIGHIKFDANPSKSIDLNSLQVGLSKNINDSTKAKISFAIYDFDKVREFNPNQITWNGKNFGNSTDVNGNYLYDFSLRNLSLEIKTEMMSLPTTFFLDMVNNSDADQNDSGFQSGLSLLISEKWKFTYLYKDIESDSTFGALTHSDFGGGGAGHKGHQFLSDPDGHHCAPHNVWRDAAASLNGSAATFSAVCYLTAQELMRTELGVDAAVGLVEADWGGSSQAPWQSRAVAVARGCPAVMDLTDGCPLATTELSPIRASATATPFMAVC